MGARRPPDVQQQRHPPHLAVDGHVELPVPGVARRRAARRGGLRRRAQRGDRGCGRRGEALLSVTSIEPGRPDSVSPCDELNGPTTLIVAIDGSAGDVGATATDT